jgi:hypothetical protein
MNPTGPENAIVQAMRDALLDPARRDQTVPVEGDAADVRFDPEPGVDVRVQFPQAPEGMALTTYKAADERPASYPPALPFLPGVSVSMLALPKKGDAGAWALWGVPDGEVERVLADLRAQSAAGGWVEREESGFDFLPGFRTLNFEGADGRQRMLQVASGGDGNAMITLLDDRD